MTQLATPETEAGAHKAEAGGNAAVDVTFRRYLAAETAIALIMSIAMSLLAALAIFGGSQSIAIKGMDGLCFDMVVQSFMVALMIVLAATILTRRRRRRGIRIEAAPMPLRLPFKNAIARAVSAAVTSAAVFGGAGALLVWTIGAEPWNLAGVYGLKIAWAIAIAVPVTLVAIGQAVSEELVEL
ncbi:hypothetical protein [Novosphingobium sp. KA1]|uniref:hypothetical protein n=1 Tax=Novosphingobium sp. (strain KA1) TaxID=164608 RepID=UPI001A8EE74F|nr:hypothetical protein [Novosphingobium sp. KA1]QSR19327.1 hypothetical protein CA833_19310 [Novosphingobium sp. KA1]